MVTLDIEGFYKYVVRIIHTYQWSVSDEIYTCKLTRYRTSAVLGTHSARKGGELTALR